jgi:hypothetical protein
MLTPNNVIKSIEISSSEPSSDSYESSISSGREGFDFPSKKKRILRKKYKPRKKDVFIHTICVTNKNDFRPENSIIETFLIADNYESSKKKQIDV